MYVWYMHVHYGNDVYIAIYVDDIIIACVDESIIISIKQQISEKYTGSNGLDTGTLEWGIIPEIPKLVLLLWISLRHWGYTGKIPKAIP